MPDAACAGALGGGPPTSFIGAELRDAAPRAAIDQIHQIAHRPSVSRVSSTIQPHGIRSCSRAQVTCI